MQILNPVGILISSMQMLVYSNFTAGVNIKHFKLRVKQTAQKLVQWIKVVMSGRFSCLYLPLLQLLKKNMGHQKQTTLCHFIITFKFEFNQESVIGEMFNLYFKWQNAI